MFIYAIRPVRNITSEYEAGIRVQIEKWENEGHTVYDPIRDTNQNDRTGLNICRENLSAIQKADEVRFMWDGKSTGCLFDLGMAFALGKTIHAVIGYVPPMTKRKSFQNFVFALGE